tara:strand:+ start:398 stop:535 length:138 start_codon:yes stop_codon:yes gene_type:complete
MSRADAIQDLYEEFYIELSKENNLEPTALVLEALRLANENYDRRV